MSPLQIAIVVIVVLAAVVALLTYFVRKKYYGYIDELDREKKKVLKQAPYEKLQEVADLNITGQSYEVRKNLEKKWREIESKKYPKLENHLFLAEQATDRYQLAESKKNQEAAKKDIEEIKAELKELDSQLTELIEREQANLEKIDLIKKRYHEVRKSLLAYSFSFGPASESFEQKLSLMENDFTEFSELTVSGDHEEANQVVERLDQKIQETEEQMEEIPPLLEQMHEVYDEQLVDLRQGYEEMVQSGYLFPKDTILEDIEHLKDDQEKVYDFIRDLELGQAHEAMDALAGKIDALYERMETELEAKPLVAELMGDIKRGLYYLQDENRRLHHLINRLSQSYVLIHNEPAILGQLEEQVQDRKEDHERMGERLKDQAIPYSVAYQTLEQMFDQLEHLNAEYKKLSDYLESYREEEVKMREDLEAMGQTMYEMKRRLENERLPGLPADYLELFFSTTDRIEDLSAELARPKIQLTEVRKLHKVCEEDVWQLQTFTDELIRQVELVERASQRLYRYKDSHKGVLETIRYSESLFSKDYDYETALKLVREKLENVAPGVYSEVVAAYEEEVANRN